MNFQDIPSNPLPFVSRNPLTNKFIKETQVSEKKEKKVQQQILKGISILVIPDHTIKISKYHTNAFSVSFPFTLFNLSNPSSAPGLSGVICLSGFILQSNRKNFKAARGDWNFFRTEIIVNCLFCVFFLYYILILENCFKGSRQIQSL